MNNFSQIFDAFKDQCNKYRKPIFAVFMIALVLLPFSGISDYVLRVVIMIGIYTILALGLNLLTGYTGQVSLGNAGFYAIGAYVAALLTTTFQMNFFLAMLIAAATAALFGLLIGLPTLRLTGTYLSIVTLGFGEIVRLVALNWESVTNGALGIKNIPRPNLFGIDLNLENKGLYFLMLVLVILVSLFCYLIINSKIGRAFISIKEDELAADLMGIKTTRYKLLAFVLSAFISGIAGSFYAHMIRFIEPNSFTFDTSIMIISIVILGGMGTMRGMYLGAGVLVAFPEILRPLQAYRFVVYGLILVLMMRFRPQGALGWKSKRPYKFPKGVREDGTLITDGKQTAANQAK
jgi:ABC-type branched-chain amino acid transport system, permease component